MTSPTAPSERGLRLGSDDNSDGASERGLGFGFYSTASARAPLTDLRAPARHPLSAIPTAGMNAITIITSAHTKVEPKAFASGVGDRGVRARRQVLQRGEPAGARARSAALAIAGGCS